MRVVFSEHALFEMEIRNIKKEDVKKLIEQTTQKIPSKKNRIIMQGRYYDIKENKEMLLRIVIEEKSKNEINIITVYKSSKIEKYWKEE